MLKESDVHVALLGQNAIVREGLRRILADEHFQVVQSVDHVSRLHCDEESEDHSCLVIIVDGSGDPIDSEQITGLRRRFPDARLVLLSDTFEFDIIVRAFRLGVDGYIIKEIGCDSLIGSLRLVAMGEKVMPSRLADNLSERSVGFGRTTADRSQALAALSERERDILSCLIMGCPNKIISRRLDISEATVKVHVKAILRKLRVQNRTQAAIWAVNRGIDGFDMSKPGDVVPIGVDNAERHAKVAA